MSMPRPTYANVTATLALVVALSGTSYAATSLGRGTVGGKQLKSNAVTAAKVKDGSLLAADFGAGQLPAGQPGPAGPAGATGSVGPAGPQLTALPAKQTLTGSFVGTARTNDGGQAGTSISFPLPTVGNVTRKVVQVGGPATAECPGGAASPAAAPGYLCVYGSYTYQASSLSLVCSADANTDCRRGALVLWFGTAAGNSEAYGTWAVTSP